MGDSTPAMRDSELTHDLTPAMGDSDLDPTLALDADPEFYPRPGGHNMGDYNVAALQGWVAEAILGKALSGAPTWAHTLAQALKLKLMPEVWIQGRSLGTTCTRGLARTNSNAGRKSTKCTWVAEFILARATMF